MAAYGNNVHGLWIRFNRVNPEGNLNYMSMIFFFCFFCFSVFSLHKNINFLNKTNNILFTGLVLRSYR